MANVIAAPGEVFETIRTREPVLSNWLAPLVYSVIASIIFTWVAFSQPAVLQEMRQAQDAELARQVASGKLTEQQAAQAKAGIEKMQDYFKYIAVAGATFMPPLILFFGALVVWILGRIICGGDYGYGKALEITGLANVIGLVTTAVTLPLVIIKGSINAGPNLLTVIPNLQPATPAGTAAAFVNLGQIWWVVVLGIGLAKCGDGKAAKGIAATGGVYLFFALIFTGLAFMRR
jgi:Yip1 domain